MTHGELLMIQKTKTKMQMNKSHAYGQFVTFEQAKLLKTIGFNRPTLLDFYNINGQLNDYSTRTDIRYQAPTLTEAIDWLRTEKDFDISIIRNSTSTTLYSVQFHFTDRNGDLRHFIYCDDLTSYTSAQSAALDAALDIILK